MKQKRIFQLILAVLALMLFFLPFLVSFNDFLTQMVKRLDWYIWLEKLVVPWEIKMVGVVVRGLGLTFVPSVNGFTVNGKYAQLTWNCLGWQSLVLWLMTLPLGFKSGNYTWLSKVETILIGFLGTFFMNLFRMVGVIILLVVSQPLYALVFHDYLAAVMTIIWLLFFWWFSYSFILEEKGD